MKPIFFAKRDLPIYYASEMAECGLICVAMVAGFFGNHTPLEELRQRFAVSPRGMTLRSVLRVAAELGIDTRSLRIELDEMRQLALPAILHWDMTHFVVLKATSAYGLLLHDPARGRVTVPWHEASRHFTGIAVELAPNTRFTSAPARRNRVLAQLLRAETSLPGRMMRILAISLAAQSIAMLMPLYAQLVIDRVIREGDVKLITSLTLIFGALILLSPLMGWVRGWSIQFASSVLGYRLARNIMSHLLSLPIRFFDNRPVGDMAGRLNSVQTILDFFSEGVIASAIDIVIGLVSGTILFLIDGRIALVVLVGLLIIVTTAMILQRQVNLRSYAEQVTRAAEMDYQFQTLSGMLSIKVLGGEQERLASWSGVHIAALNATLALARLRVTADELRRIMLNLHTLLLVFLSALAVMKGTLSAGGMFAILVYRQILAERVDALLAAWQKFGGVRVHLDRLADILEAEPEIPPSRPRAQPIDATVELQHVSFSYSVHDELILRDASLRVEEGDFIAIVGPSGTGKTTALKLMLGLCLPSDGNVILGRRNAKEVDLATWRSMLGVVSQNDHLFSGSIIDNVTLFTAEADEERFRLACMQAGILGDILAMPMGPRTLVGHMGASLSGGQAQRLLLARALYRQPQILLLDEGTASLDPAAETAIADFVAGLDITRIVIAHRPALLTRAKRCFRLRNGGFEEFLPEVEGIRAT